MFKFDQIRSAGLYETRFFRGDSANGQGYACRGLEGGSATDYTVCSLEAAVTSSVIDIKPGGPGAGGKAFQRHGGNIPGLEYSHLM